MKIIIMMNTWRLFLNDPELWVCSSVGNHNGHTYGDHLKELVGVAIKEQQERHAYGCSPELLLQIQAMCHRDSLVSMGAKRFYSSSAASPLRLVKKFSGHPHFACRSWDVTKTAIAPHLIERVQSDYAGIEPTKAK